MEELFFANWVSINDVPHSKHAYKIMRGCEGFVAEIGGKLGVISIDDISEETKIKFQPAHRGKLVRGGKTVYEAVANFKNRPVKNITTLIVGPVLEGYEHFSKDPSKPIVYTFHPGYPVTNSNKIFKRDIENYGLKIHPDNCFYGKKNDAVNLGFLNIKYAEI